MRHKTIGTGFYNSPRAAAALAIGLALALAGIVATSLPAIARLETQIGLGWLFLLQGPRPAPSDVVVISMDHQSSRRLGLPNVPREWPRTLHARLVEQLMARGVRTIAFDVNFAEARDSIQDAHFASAMRKAGNVLLFAYLRQMPPISSHGLGPIRVETLVPPTEELAQAAAGLAPFPLPVVPTRVSQAWLFKASIGDMPTLPVLALQQYAQPYYPAFRALLAAAGRAVQPQVTMADLPASGADLVTTARRLRELFQRHPALAEVATKKLVHVGAADAAALHRALLTVYSGPDSCYLNFYGPPRSITTVPYHEVLTPDPVRDYLGKEVGLRNKVTFVGFSENFQPEQSDGFYTVFSQPDGLDISGVEIAATIFANLLEGRSVLPLPLGLQLLLIATWGLLVGVLLMIVPGVMAVPAAGLLAAGGIGMAYLLFSAHSTWLPLVVTLLLQLPLGLAAALLGHYLQTQRGREGLQHTLSVYLPRSAVAELARPAAKATQIGRAMFAVCMATDIAGYSALAEDLAPDKLRGLLNRYFAMLFAPVRHHGGEVCDIKGDAMIAVWIEGQPEQLRAAACRAALEIYHAMNSCGHDLQNARLPTRIGLHCGQMQLGTVGSGDHFEYRPVGEIVNTAARLESLSKYLGTWLLASSQVVADLNGIVRRELGCFKPAGKSTPLIVHEILFCSDAADVPPSYNGPTFEHALDEFRAGNWSAAHAAFADYLSTHGHDGPARFYLRMCARYQRKPPAQWDGTITLRDK
ncbi:MAG TPA: adenylate/guanylate cyclase domain-containing protein [Gammaproteobacteria bacterium]|nr:adenylate/guanylate cyclase domain-containing protein [Gammaproteobacteria bacterium]